MNVFINTKSMNDKDLALEYNNRAESLNREAAQRADKIFIRIEEALKCR